LQKREIISSTPNRQSRIVPNWRFGRQSLAITYHVFHLDSRDVYTSSRRRINRSMANARR